MPYRKGMISVKNIDGGWYICIGPIDHKEEAEVGADILRDTDKLGRLDDVPILTKDSE